MIEVRFAGPGDERFFEDDALLDDPLLAPSLAAFGRDHDWLVLATVDGRAAGFAIVHLLPHPSRPKRQGFLYEIGTAERFQRQGVARAVIDFVLLELRRRGAEELWVITNRSNPAAVGLYRSTGAHSEADDDAVFVWPISPGP